jgi:hypothetical protein
MLLSKRLAIQEGSFSVLYSSISLGDSSESDDFIQVIFSKFLC